MKEAEKSDRNRRVSPASDVRDRAARTIKRTGKIKINLKRFILSMLVLVFCVYFAGKMISQQVVLSHKNDEIQEITEQINSASRETDRLEDELESVNDPEYLERMAREKLGLVVPNERVYIDANSSD